MWEFLKMLTRRKIKKEIVINKESLQSRVVILEEGKLEDFFIERNSEDRIVGSIFKGKIQNLEDGLQAAFIDLGLKKNAFIHYWDMIPEDTARLEAEEGIDSKRSGGGSRQKRFSSEEIAKRFPIGSEIIVQVTKAAKNFLTVLGFVSEDGSMTNVQLADYVAANILDGLSRVDGIGEASL